MSYSIQSHIQVRGLGTPEDTSTPIMDVYTLSGADWTVDKSVIYRIKFTKKKKKKMKKKERKKINKRKNIKKENS